jgi:hypothetical protein
MAYESIKDIMPALIAATENGKISWTTEGTSDYTVVIGDNKIEIEKKTIGEGDQKSLALALYLWDNSNKIIDSALFLPENPEYDRFNEYFATVRRAATKVPEVLDKILKALK